MTVQIEWRFFCLSKVGNLEGLLPARRPRRSVYIPRENLCLSQRTEFLSEKQLIFNSKVTYVKFHKNKHVWHLQRANELDFHFPGLLLLFRLTLSSFGFMNLGLCALALYMSMRSPRCVFKTKYVYGDVTLLVVIIRYGFASFMSEAANFSLFSLSWS